GAGARRALHSRRSFLPFVESKGIRFCDALYRAGGRNQYIHAIPRGGSDYDRSEQAKEKSEWFEAAHFGCCVQKGRGRFAGIADTEDYAALAGTRGATRLQRSVLSAATPHAPLQLRRNEICSAFSTDARLV